MSLRSIPRIALASVLAFGALVLGTPALAAWNSSSVAMGPPKSLHAESFRSLPGTIVAQELNLEPIDPLEIAAVKEANGAALNKRLQIGINRSAYSYPEAESALIRWERVDGGFAAHWRVISPDARALRVGVEALSTAPGMEIRFSGVGEPGTVYGPFSAADLRSGDPTYWSPVLTGESATVEIFLPEGTSPAEVSVALTQVSHLFVHPADPDAVKLAKDGSQPCEVDLICSSATDAALASVGKSVAKMSFVVAGQGSFMCTGTLLNPADGSQTPYFYSAAHCISTQSVASTLTTHWFYERSVCRSGGTGPNYVQLPGGATLLHANATSDALFVRLNRTPPAGAVYAAWDSATISTGTALTAVHHPQGDWKKVSIGTMGGFDTTGGGSFIIANWTSTATGVTEQGSSGSGIFTAVGQPASEYRFRGGLCCGPSSCTAISTNLFDYYSRFDQAYASISQYLSPAVVVTSYTLTVTKSGTGTGTVSSAPGGISCGATCSALFASGTSVTLTPIADSGSTFSGWTGACSGTGTCQVSMTAATSVAATFTLIPPPVLTVSASSVAFGNQLVQTTSVASSFTITNTGGGTLSLTGIALTPGFGLNHSCVSLAAGASCSVNVTFTPSAPGTHNGTLTIASNAGSKTVTLAGVGQESLVAHYYDSILRRAGEAGGVVFWNGEALRLHGVGANVNETWFAMAMSFYFSPEYAAFNRNDADFLTDLYSTFYKRLPDASGLSFWSGQIASGMPREVVLLSFMFSPEFATFTQGLFGNTAARAEVDTVMDFYRGLLSRLPDSGGLTFYVQQFRTAQCQGAGAVYAQVETVSSGFANGAEYAGRNRTNAQFVADLYNAFLRRGGDLGGVLYWINELQTGARTRDQVRRAFLASPEFTTRVNAIVAQGCL